jgi:hypothetical protein
MPTKKYTVKLERWAAEQPENDTYSVVAITGPTVEIPFPHLRRMSLLSKARVGDVLSAKQANQLGSVATLSVKRALA